jgi:hypothetical protein
VEILTLGPAAKQPVAKGAREAAYWLNRGRYWRIGCSKLAGHGSVFRLAGEWVEKLPFANAAGKWDLHFLDWLCE